LIKETYSCGRIRSGEVVIDWIVSLGISGKDGIGV
jgi:hypothetical protein